MLKLRANKLTALIDHLNSVHLIGAILLLTFGFALGYRALSDEPVPSNGLRLPSDNTTNRVTLGDAVYFSIVTEATLGYGDIRPVGWSRVLACCQVVLGLALAGVVVAKITSMQGRELRMLQRRVSGDWIEFLRLPDGRINVSFVTMGFSGTVLRYDGESYRETAEPAGFWRGEMIGLIGSCLRFDYSNRESHTVGDSFSEGIASLQFTADPHGRMWIRYVGTAHDFGTKKTLTWQAVRASPEDSTIIHGTDDQLRAELIKRYCAKLPPARATGDNAEAP